MGVQMRIHPQRPDLTSTGLLRRFAGDRRGVSAVAFAISFAVLAPMTLGIFDVYTSTEQRGKLQDALDAATLYAARSPAVTSADIAAAGDKALAANLQMIHGASLHSSSFALVGTKVVATASVDLPAFAPAEFTHAPVTVNAEVQRALDRLEVVLVLDNTGSMSGTKIATLKTQAKILIDKLVVAAARSSDPYPLKIALVPFSQTVRVQGTTPLSGTNYNTVSHTGPAIPAWIDPEGKAHATAGVAFDTFDVRTDRLTMMRNIGQSWAGCVETRPAPYDVQEDAPNPATPATLYVPYFWPDEPGSKTSNTYYNSYLADTTGSGWKQLEQAHSKYALGATVRSGAFASGYNYGPNAGCGLQPMMRLTTDTNAVKTAIDGMNAVGETNIPVGLIWGWHTLSPQGPFADGSPYGTLHLKKVVIVMTDGENTFTAPGSSNLNRSMYDGLGYIWQRLLTGATESSSNTQRTAAMDARLTLLCNNMKARNIQIYTVRVEVTSGSSALLQGCASHPTDFYDVTDVATLGAAFDAIAGSISNLRISH